MACKAVAATTWDDGQCGGGVDECACNFVDGAIAPYGYYDVDAVGGRLACELLGVSGIFGVANSIVKLGCVDEATDALAHVELLIGARFGIDDE